MASFSSNLSTQIHPQVIFLITNFSSFVTLKLDSQNYVLWKAQVKNALVASSLFDYVNGIKKCPPKEIRDQEGTSIQNPDFVEWFSIEFC